MTRTGAKLIAAMAPEFGSHRNDVRDRALLLMGYAAVFRHSELVAVDAKDITGTEDGLRIAARKSKSD